MRAEAAGRAIWCERRSASCSGLTIRSSRPMAPVPQLAAAVSNASALGIVTLTWSPFAGDVVRETAALTDRAFGGNFVLASDQHRRLDEALESGLPIVSRFGAIPLATSTRPTTPTPSFCRRSAAPKKHGGPPAAESMSSWHSAERSSSRLSSIGWLVESIRAPPLDKARLRNWDWDRLGSFERITHPMAELRARP